MNRNKEKENEKKNRRQTVMYAFFSVILSISVWIYIAYYQNPEMTKSVYDIPIVFEGEQFLTENNLVLSSVDIRDLDIRFAGKWNNISGLSNTNVTAYVDLSVIVTRYSANPGTYMLDYDLVYDNISAANVEKDYTQHDTVVVTVEKLITQNINVRGVFNGAVADGYELRQMTLESNTISISGPQQDVSQVAGARVTLNVDEISRTVTEECNIVLVDADGNELNLERVTLSQNTMKVTQPVEMRKEVIVTVPIVYGNTATKDNTIITIEPETVLLRGPSDQLEDLNQIELTSTIDLTKEAYRTAKAQTFTIPIPNGLTNLSDTNTVTVTVQVRDMTTMRFSTTRLQTMNVTEGYAARFITQSLDVTLRGTEDVLSDISGEDIVIVADLSGLNESTGVVIVDGDVMLLRHGDEVDAIGGNYEVTLEIYVSSSEPEAGDAETAEGEAD